MARKRNIDVQEDITLEDAPDVPITEAPSETDPRGADEPDAPEGLIWLTYRGHAAALTFGEIVLKPGRPTPVSKVQAEGILTHPFEEVETSMSPPSPPEE